MCAGIGGSGGDVPEGNNVEGTARGDDMPRCGTAGEVSGDTGVDVPGEMCVPRLVAEVWGEMVREERGEMEERGDAVGDFDAPTRRGGTVGVCRGWSGDELVRCGGDLSLSE